MKNFFKILADVTMDIINNITYFIKSNLVNIANVLNLLCPYTMYIIGQCAAIERNYFGVGGEVFIPIAFIVIIYYLKSSANKIGKGISIPVPSKRFTEINEDGEVSIENKRVQELILYLADLEDWMERKGLIE